jgi:hypothetical protein
MKLLCLLLKRMCGRADVCRQCLDLDTRQIANAVDHTCEEEDEREPS